MNFILYFVLLAITLHTFRFAWTVWKEKNKIGSIAIMILGVSIAVLPSFTIF
ncbi:hypothetical protein ACE38V_08870 [Cytobacillus sp. Hz8]|uniref:hypothetical protein n=1 Tax=Cytobacillus sp. Hz8 TaxID=3347168 RepID=UPI0035D8B2A8